MSEIRYASVCSGVEAASLDRGESSIRLSAITDGMVQRGNLRLSEPMAR